MTEPCPRRRPDAPGGARSWILLVLDSCRYDTMVEAHPENLLAVGALERRWTSATWTAPSHYNLLMGLLPHAARPGQWAADVYAADLARFRDRLGVDLDLSQLAPDLWLPDFLRTRGWVTGAAVSLPVLNEATPLARGFDHFTLRDRHNDLRGILDDLRFYAERPAFWLINAGETHYPYERPDREYEPLPHLSGAHGAIKGRLAPQEPRFTSARLEELRLRQVDAVRYVDSLIPRLRALAPPGTWLTVTSDHGECFGEGGWFGHGPVVHDKVLEVPFLEGQL